jgi:hypothetical protein
MRRASITHYAYERIRGGEAVPGVFEIDLSSPLSQILEDLLLIAECSLDGEYEGRVVYLPMLR